MTTNGASILIVDDDETVCVALSMMLRAREYAVQTETRSSRVLERLRRSRFDLIVLDLVMPEVYGLQLLGEIKSEFAALPVVILTGISDTVTAIEAMQAGASDFMTKPIEGAFLDLRIQRAIDMERTKRLADIDGLTGLYNHRVFQQRLDEEIKRAQRHGRPLTLLLLDVDHFKAFNDTHGHPKGDAALVELARLLQEVSRSEDVVARYGGEEFAVIAPETDPEGARIIADRLKEMLQAPRLGEKEYPARAQITVSVGAAGLKPGSSKQGLVEAADRALYQAKRAGRNQVCVASA